MDKSAFQQQAPIDTKFDNADSEKTEKITKKGEMEEIHQRRRNRNKEERRLMKDQDDLKKGLERYIEPIAQFVNPPALFGDYLLTNRIGTGAFSRCFLARRLIDSRQFAIKVDSAKTHVDMMSNEAMILRTLNRNGPVPHFAKIIHFFRSPSCRYIVMTLLGETLAQLKRKTMDGRFTVATWSKFGLQILYGLKMLHDLGFVHRDLKPDNLMLGAPDDPSRRRVVQIIDFTSSRQFAVKVGNVWMVRPHRKRIHFTGNVHFVSPSMHFGKEQGRKDDLWSLIFTLVDLNGQLPWADDIEEKRILDQKLDPKVCLKDMPKSMGLLMGHLAGLNAFQRPCYHLFYKVFLQISRSQMSERSDKYTHELFDLPRPAKDFKGPHASWESDDVEDYYKKDPLEINGPAKVMTAFHLPKSYQTPCCTEVPFLFPKQNRDNQMKFGQMKTTEKTVKIAMKNRAAEKYNKKNYVRMMRESGQIEYLQKLEEKVLKEIKK